MFVGSIFINYDCPLFSSQQPSKIGIVCIYLDKNTNKFRKIKPYIFNVSELEDVYTFIYV